MRQATSKITKWLDQTEATLAPQRVTVVGCNEAECQHQIAAKRAQGEIGVDDEVFMICTGVPRSPRFLSRPDPI
jgi:hypothetical protein